MTQYIKGSSGAMIVCDLSRPDTVVRLLLIKDRVKELCPNVPLIFIGNKLDLVKDDDQSIQQLKNTAAEANLPYELTSAKTGTEVETAFNLLAQMMISSHG